MRLIVAVVAALTGCVVGEAGNPAGIDVTSDSVRDSVRAITTISYAPNSYVIGNAYPAWHDVIQGPAQFSEGPGNPDGASYRWGFLYGEDFDRCAWIDNGVITADTSQHGADLCGGPQQIDTRYFLAEFTDGIHNQLAGDGSVTHMQYDGSGCDDINGYGNVEPWRVPATPANLVGPIANGHELLWRYVSRDGDWVLVRDPDPPADRPNWYFVHRGCVSVANVD